ncbi:MAG TPA: hypothetical protein VGC95_12535 [Chitinophagaceae bacterium]
MKNPFLIALIALAPVFSYSQSLHGLWSGTLTNDSTHRVQNFELGLSEYRGKITGYTYTTFIDNDTFYYSIKRVRAERKDGKLVIEDEDMVANNFPEKTSRRVRQTTVFPLVNDSTIDISKGRWNTNRTKKYYSIGGSSSVSVLQNEQQSDLLAHLVEANVQTDITVAERKPAPRTTDEKTGVTANQQTKTSTHNGSTTADNRSVTKPNPVASITSQQPAPSEVVKQASLVTNPGQQPAPGSQQKNSVATPSLQNEQANVHARDVKTTDSLRSVVKNSPSAQRVQQTNGDRQTYGVQQNNPIPQKAAVQQNNPIREKAGAQQNNVIAQKAAVQETSNVNQQGEHATTKTQPSLQPQTTGTAADHVVQQPNKPGDTRESASNGSVNASIPKTREAAAIVSAKELPTIVESRKTETIETLTFSADSLVLSLYDNGIVDGDTVSVFLNGEPVIARQMLKASATKKTIYLSPAADSVQLVLFAENLGTIPPNTGLLTIRDGDQVYQVRFSADLQKNASVILRRKKL